MSIPLSPISPTDSHGPRQVWVDEFPPAPDKSDNAEIWRTYVEKADEYDGALIRRWNEGMDVFLLFTGLYSAILSAFLMASWSMMQPDTGQATVDALTAVSSQLAAFRTDSSNLSVVYEMPSFNPPMAAIVVNALWFSSLSISLFAAIGAMLVKEWLSAYTQNVAIVPVERAQQRQFRYAGLNKWGLPTIVSFLPISIHLAVFLFFTGLVVFTWPVNWPLSLLLMALLAAGVALYAASSLAPVFYADCPYKSPLYPVLQFVWVNARLLASRAVRRVRRTQRQPDEEALTNAGGPFAEYSEMLERRYIEEQSLALQSQALGWLVNSPDHAAQAEALHFMAWWRMPATVWTTIEDAVQNASSSFLRRRLGSIMKNPERDVSREELEWLALISSHASRAEAVVPSELIEHVSSRLRFKTPRHAYHDALISIVATNAGENTSILHLATARLLICLTFNSNLLKHVERVELISVLSSWGLAAAQNPDDGGLGADDTKTVLARALLTTCALLNPGGGMQLSRLLETLRYVTAAGIGGKDLEEPLLHCLNQWESQAAYLQYPRFYRSLLFSSDLNRLGCLRACLGQ
ncbi:hypothetical protein CALVIDRAFT_553525 [Calocera viscosa TUFC12733]|uniref:DUF6535 domain-containing protein n=1 Tax=Calocera viscosa (strain TUFC12733) TaxID=1330018 RepID=A0A167PW84_CALVF|nr:hypothetical protein CALVIDRAFT_553525 [Calocera viscosa TUFC12733]